MGRRLRRAELHARPTEPGQATRIFAGKAAGVAFSNALRQPRTGRNRASLRPARRARFAVGTRRLPAPKMPCEADARFARVPDLRAARARKHSDFRGSCASL